MIKLGSYAMVGALIWSAGPLATPGNAQVTPPPPGTPPEQVQQQIQAMGLGGQLRARLEASGMTPAQIRSRLASMGYDPSTLDAYLSGATLGTTPPEPSASVLSALSALGIEGDTMAVVDRRPEATPPTLEEERVGLRVFGVQVFSRGSSQFDPLMNAAVPSSYVLGPGDELVLMITGEVEFVHNLPVTREGFVVIPQVGQVWVNGKTMEQLRSELFTRLGAVYSGIQRGGGGSTQFDISLARLRSNQIYISGEVAQAGAYTVSPLASVLNALYQAGGPTGNGSFRDVHVLRGGVVVHRVDLYQFLLGGDNLDRIRLEPGDVVHVPTHGKHVSISGEVSREAIFEMTPAETIRDLLAFAGGTTAPAHLRRARLTRVLPPEERTTPGVDRVIVDIDLAEAIRNPAAAPRLQPGDAIEVLAVNETIRNILSLNGSVWRPGSYEYRPGMRAWDLIEAGLGLTPEAFPDRAHISRVNPDDSSLTLIPFTLARDESGAIIENPVLQEFDVVTVYSRAAEDVALPVQITGEVRSPSTEQYQEGMTLRDAIIRAGGLLRTADMTVEVSRLADPADRASGQIAEIYHIPLDSTYFVSEEAARHYLGDPAALSAVVGGGPAAEFRLEPQDRILVRRLPALEMPRVVQVTGEVEYPGSYTLQRKDETLRDMILTRAGGLTPAAYASGFRLFRAGQLVNIDLPQVIARVDHRDNLQLMPGDSLHMPEYNPIVVVNGAVNSPVTVTYREGAGLDYYIENAGGYARHADKNRVHVRYQNGEGRTVQRTMFFRSEPTPGPGSVVTVPLTPPDDRLDLRGSISDIAQILAAIASVALILSR